jgi:hypothetical protein
MRVYTGVEAIKTDKRQYHHVCCIESRSKKCSGSIEAKVMLSSLILCIIYNNYRVKSLNWANETNIMLMPDIHHFFLML